ncbi:alpha/beta fold hydrolase [Vagococcus silagei]|nr:alpha/beta hydrolase [Vagococcus silagei]
MYQGIIIMKLARLEEDFKIVVVEKFGYGFSSDTENSRDIDTILEETRGALNKKGIKPPYMLAPHSMSGIEALYWYKKYPQEISTIIGLDMATYEAYENLKISLIGLKINRWLVKANVTKIFPKAIESDAVKYGNLAQIEKDTYKELFYKNFTSTATLNEVREVKRNSKKVRDIDLKSLPLLILVSNGKGTGIKKDKWFSIQENLRSKSRMGKIVYYDCPHYLHNHKALEIAKEIKLFIKEI